MEYVGEGVRVACGAVTYLGTVQFVDWAAQTIVLESVLKNGQRLDTNSIALNSATITDLQLLSPHERADVAAALQLPVVPASAPGLQAPSAPAAGATGSASPKRNGKKDKRRNSKAANPRGGGSRQSKQRGVEFDTPIEDSIGDDFDFAGNLALFNKEQVWAEFKESEGDRSAELLVTHNLKHRVEAKLRPDENVLDTGPAVAPMPATYGPDVQFRSESLVPIPSVSLAELRDVYAAAGTAGLSRAQIVENGGRSACSMVMQLLGGSGRIHPKNAHQMPRVVVLVSHGCVAAEAVCAARHLANHGLHITLFIQEQDVARLSKAAEQVRLYTKTDGATVLSASGLPAGSVDLVIDALSFGDDASLGGDVARYSRVARWCKDKEANVLALDVPWAVDFSSDGPQTLPIPPKWILHFALPRKLPSGVACPQVLLADVGIPKKVFAECGLAYTPAFVAKFVIRLERIT